jgi:hypothetical protein
MKGFHWKARAGVVLFALILPVSGVYGQVVVPDLGDINCDGIANVVDVQLAIKTALGFPLTEILDANGEGGNKSHLWRKGGFQEFRPTFSPVQDPGWLLPVRRFSIFS